ncbi:MAG TPA: S-adenosylmethionine:tRNA ribosyltransferase-isomerase [Pseudonocardiaceae bacterium]|jgi:S-adenosylmethionine:tRNA ribosyltransferase-isomerase|nr:S-adenosylmethionine:tRNA ribosyltransferase-isomerase [Pseudonocardiaceae bacterium]
MSVLEFSLPDTLEAHEPPEARGLARDGVRLLVGRAASGSVSHHRFTDLPALLRAGDVLVVNTSGTLPAAVGVVGSPLTAHLSTERPDGRWLVELRRNRDKATVPFDGGRPGEHFALVGGGALVLRERYSRERLWIAEVDTGKRRSVAELLAAQGKPIHYGYVRRPWPLSYYQTVFADHPGSAEMPSAARPFTAELVTRLVASGVLLVPVLLHTGVASPEAHERPYPEFFTVPPVTARVLNQAKAAGGRVIAVGTTAVRAVESATDEQGLLAPRSGWTELIITPDRGVRVVDGLLTGFHEPKASHLDMLAAIAPADLLSRCYAAAIEAGYLWHEFGDVNLLLP